MNIAIIGGTGVIGRAVAAHLRARGHAVRVLSRRSAEHPVDVTTGAGLDAALAGADVVVDAVNGAPRSPGPVLVDGIRRVLEAEARAGVTHHVGVSIVGAERVPLAYYRAKVEQERVVAAGAVPWTIVRGTQLHDLVGGLLSSAARRHVLPGARLRVQPLAVEELAAVVADVAEGPPRRRAIEVAGPETLDLRELGRLWRDTTGERLVELPIPLPGRVGRALRGGALVATAPDVRGTTTFATWLQTRA